MAIEEAVVDEQTLVCEWCGGVIDDLETQDCPARDDGRCLP